MLKVNMKYYDSNNDTKYVFTDDEYDKIYVFNEDKMEISDLSNMGSMIEVFNDVDTNYGNVYVNANLQDVIEFLTMYEDEIKDVDFIVAKLEEYEG